MQQFKRRKAAHFTSHFTSKKPEPLMFNMKCNLPNNFQGINYSMNQLIGLICTLSNNTEGKKEISTVPCPFVKFHSESEK